MPGRFITFEGIEGVGKSTQLKLAAERLRRNGLDVVVTREPGGTPLAEAIRQLVLERREESVDSVSELLLMFASRSVHLANLIEPSLSRGSWVLCDRFTDATEAYQGHGRGIPLEHIRALEEISQRGRRPDLTLLLDAPVDVAMARTFERGGPGDRIEAERAEFFQRVRHGYLAIQEREPERVRRIDATGPLVEVEAAVAGILDPFVKGAR
jgi:dTMP kinase